MQQSDRLAVVREVYTEVAGAGKAGRVDIFNGNYGLMRGLTAALVVTFILAIVAGKGLTVLGVVAALFLLAVHRMHRYGRHYATELFVQYLAIKAKTATAAS